MNHKKSCDCGRALTESSCGATVTMPWALIRGPEYKLGATLYFGLFVSLNFATNTSIWIAIIYCC